MLNNNNTIIQWNNNNSNQEHVSNRSREIQPEAYWQEQMDCQEVWLNHLDKGRKICSETGMANAAYEIQRRERKDFRISQIASAAQPRH